MKKEERNYMLSFITKAMDYAIFQWEVERLEKMMPKYVNPQYIPSKEEVSNDIKFLETILD